MFILVEFNQISMLILVISHPITFFMKGKLVLNLLIFIAVSFSSFAQSSFSDSILWGTSLKVGKNEGYPQFIEHTSKATFLITKLNNMISSNTVSIFATSSLSFKGEYKLKFTLENSQLDIETHFVFSDTLFFVTSDKVNSTNIKNFYLQTLDESGKIGSPRLIASVKFGSVKNAYSAKGRDAMYRRYKSFQVVKSPDGKSLAVLFPNDFDGTYEQNNQWNIAVYDADFRIVERTEFTIEEADIHLAELALANDREIYILGQKNYSMLKSKLVSTISSLEALYPVGSNYFLYYFDSESKTIQATDLELMDRGVINARIKIMDEDVLIYGLTGSFSKNDVLAEGYFIQKLSLNGELLFSTIDAFNDESYKYHSYQNVDSKKSSLRLKQRNFLLGDIFKNDSGGFVFLAEQYKFYVDQVQGQYGSSVNGRGSAAGPYGTGLNHMFGNILVLGFSNECSLNWTKRLFKSENYGKEGDFLSSYFAQLKGNNLHIIINDDLYRTNEEMYNDLGKKEVARAVRDNIVSEIIIDENGQSERNLLIDIDNDEDQQNSVEANLKGKLIAPRTFYITENGSVVFFGRFLVSSGIGPTRHDDHYIRMGKMYTK